MCVCSIVCSVAGAGMVFRRSTREAVQLALVGAQGVRGGAALVGQHVEVSETR